MDMYTICTDLQGEQNARDTILANLDEAGWNTPTPAPMGPGVNLGSARPSATGLPGQGLTLPCLIAAAFREMSCRASRARRAVVPASHYRSACQRD
jgi:hypothetical protein